MQKFYKIIKPIFIQLNSIKLFFFISRIYYKSVFRLSCRFFLNFREIKAIYSRGSFAEHDWIPWESDIDITVVIEDLKPDIELKFLKKFWQAYRIQCIFFPLIQHIDLFSITEFNAHIKDGRWIGDYFRTDLLLVAGKGEQKIVYQNVDGVFALRLFDWNLFAQWVYEDNLDAKLYARKYYRFFNKILTYCKERSSYTEKMRQLLDNHVTADFWLNKPKNFVLKGFYYSQIIFTDTYKQVQHLASDTCGVGALRKDSYAVSQKEDAFIKGILIFKSNIKSIFVDSESIRNKALRIWVILKDDIKEDDFFCLMMHIKKAILKNPIHPYIFTESSLNLFLSTQRLWAFESHHLCKYAEIIYGENVLNKLKKPSSEAIMRMAQSSLLIYKVGIRYVTYMQDDESYRKFIFVIIGWKLFVERNIVATTANELFEFSKKYLSEIDNYVLDFCGNATSIDKATLFPLIKTVLDDLTNRLDNSKSLHLNAQ